MKKFIITAMALIAFGCSQKTAPLTTNSIVKPFSTDGKSVAVYMTADSSNFKLSLTDNVQFRDLSQPNEGQISVFVDPTKTFQTFMGIGAALTDASAEIFAKLSKDKQKTFLEAYFSPEKGIGYTLALKKTLKGDFRAKRERARKYRIIMSTCL